MAFLKEDGSLDIEYYNSLPLEEWMDEFASLTDEQVDEYISKLPANESKEPVRVTVSDYTLEEELERGAITHEELMNILKMLKEELFPSRNVCLCLTKC